MILRRLIAIGFGIGILCYSVCCFADIIELSDGRIIEGTITEETPYAVQMTIGSRNLLFPKNKIVHIEKGQNASKKWKLFMDNIQEVKHFHH